LYLQSLRTYNLIMNQMNSQNIAQGLAALGRGNDSMLMHVTPREVYGLQSLAMAAGGSLSVNPHTGLPEAGFFDFLGNMLPQIAGTAIGVATGNPYIGAAVAGAGETAKSGNLMSGIMAGLGAYGGANLFQGVANAAPGAASATGAGASTANLPSATQLGSSATAAQQAGQAPMAGMVGSPADLSPQSAALQSVTASDPMGFAGTLTEGAKLGTAPFGGSVGAQTGITSPTLGTMSSKAPMTFENLKAGFSNIMGDGGIKSLQQGLGEAGKPITGGQLAARAAMPIAQAAISASAPEQFEPEDNSKLWGKYTPLSEFRKRYRGYAEGGVLEQNPLMPDTSRQSLKFDMRDHPLEEPIGNNAGYARGGYRGYAKGGYLDGPGDGMSDDIPATIEGKQPARLADGEFVVPADVVSHLGNGSTKAGAKRLYEMMARVRKARTGNDKQGKQINPNKFVPA
jgi:hypothetical protein